MATIREAQIGDCADILELIQELADYEREPDAVRNTVPDLEAHLFCPNPQVFAHVAEDEGQIVGVALWYLTYSTWEGRHGIHLEDLYVRESQRGRGTGAALLRTLAEIAVSRGYRRVEWAVLDWNTPAIEFYDALGASSMDGWTTRRLDGAALEALGGVQAARS
ncbi:MULTISPECIES: GNAT family N-acetyltransferase [unclassified Glutamicibacter]|uniref:GNAT family N-acetyltransferase n=1 Tax=Glutamicibacter sp. PS TaxID=3075634 RepID=UPI00283D5335|nr:GNAT family N-acetyltransferase [Glutamicibacter sp. PS]MDR4532538.1 GNAT family N-acetyltransferase [Glutamicibacter sp. PS]